MAFYAVKAHVLVHVVILVISLFPVAIFTFRSGGSFASLAQLHNPAVGIVAVNTFEREVLSLEKLFVLLVVFDESALGIDALHLTPAMAFAAHLRITLDFHGIPSRIRHVQSARAMASFAANTFLRPGANDSRHIILTTVW